MAIFDVMFEFSDAQDVYSNATNVRSTDILDWGSGMTDLEMGAGTPIWLNIKVTTAFAGGTHCQFKLCGDADGDSSFTGAVVIYETPAIAIASLTANAWVLRVPLNVNVDDNRYLGLICTCTGNMTAGAIDAWLDHGPQSSFDTQVATSNI